MRYTLVKFLLGGVPDIFLLTVLLRKYGKWKHFSCRQRPTDCWTNSASHWKNTDIPENCLPFDGYCCQALFPLARERHPGTVFSLPVRPFRPFGVDRLSTRLVQMSIYSTTPIRNFRLCAFRRKVYFLWCTCHNCVSVCSCQYIGRDGYIKPYLLILTSSIDWAM